MMNASVQVLSPAWMWRMLRRDQGRMREESSEAESVHTANESSRRYSACTKPLLHAFRSSIIDVVHRLMPRIVSRLFRVRVQCVVIVMAGLVICVVIEDIVRIKSAYQHPH